MTDLMAEIVDKVLEDLLACQTDQGRAIALEEWLERAITAPRHRNDEKSFIEDFHERWVTE